MYLRKSVFCCFFFFLFPCHISSRKNSMGQWIWNLNVTSLTKANTVFWTQKAAENKRAICLCMGHNNSDLKKQRHKNKKETTKMPGKGRGYHFSQIQLSWWYTPKLYSPENKAKFCKCKVTEGVRLHPEQEHLCLPQEPPQALNICSEYVLWEHKRGGNTYVQQFC